MTNTQHHNILPLIDELVDLRARRAQLDKREEELKNDLKALGPGTHVTDNSMLTLTEQQRDVLDMKAVRDKLSDQFIRAHTKTTKFLVFKVAMRSQATQEAAE
jgi:hypothetical protein